MTRGARRWIAPAAGAAVLAAGLRSAPAQDEAAAAKRTLALAQTVASDFPVAAWRVADVDRDGADDLLVVGRRGEVRVWRGNAETGLLADTPSGVLVLPDPSRSVLALADVLGTGGPPQLAVVSRSGLDAYPVGPDGAFARAPVAVSGETKLVWRVGQPTFAEMLRDVNGDGRPDLVLPHGDVCELWLQAPPPEGAAAGTLPTYRATGAFRVEVSRDRATSSEALSDVLQSSFRIPSLAFDDVNGDGRKDLVVAEGKIRAFHLARDDGSISREPDVRVDLAKFTDTTPDAEVRLGRTLAGDDSQKFESADLDGDGVPDHVITHRRKVWVFLGTRAGPQFTEPSQILKVADDVSATLVARLDQDPRADLLLLRVQVPTIATLLRGLVASWDVSIDAVGYENEGAGKFSTTPKWTGGVALRLPSILGILRDPDALVRRFEGLATKFKRSFVPGDFDGDGSEDAAVAASDARRLDVWFGIGREPTGGGGTNGRGGGGGANGPGGDADLGGVFFGKERDWDLDRVLQWLGDYADRRFARVTGGREPSQRIALRLAGDADLDGVAAARLGPRQPVVVAYLDANGHGVFDLWR